jgi:hypothetical protein
MLAWSNGERTTSGSIDDGDPDSSVPLGKEHVQSPCRIGVVGRIKSTSERVSLRDQLRDVDEYRYSLA